MVANYYRKLMFTAFDEEVAEASGIDTKWLNYLLVSLVAVTIGLSIKIVGVLLIGALMIIPVISAMQFGRSFFVTGILAVVLSVLAVVTGLLFSFYVSLPSGATIVTVSIVIFVVSLISKAILAR